MPRDIFLLTEADLRATVPLDTGAIAVVEDAFRALATDKVVMPPILSMEIAEAHGEVDVKTAYIPGFDGFAIKISPGFFDNPSIGLPSLNGLMVLLSAKTGLVEAVLLDNGYLTDVRTAAAGAVAAKHLAPPVETAAVLGAGVQARLQMLALHQVRPFARARVWARDREKAAACAADIARATGAAVEAVDDPATAVAGAQAVVTTTPAAKPILTEAMLHPGLHVTAMGSDAAGKNEIAPEALAAADLYVADRISQCALVGELRAARAGGLMPQDPPELGQVVAGRHPGRTSPEQVTICDLTGTGAQDTAIATYALAAARKAGRGTLVQA